MSDDAADVPDPDSDQGGLASTDLLAAMALGSLESAATLTGQLVATDEDADDRLLRIVRARDFAAFAADRLNELAFATSGGTEGEYEEEDQEERSNSSEDVECGHPLCIQDYMAEDGGDPICLEVDPDDEDEG